MVQVGKAYDSACSSSLSRSFVLIPKVGCRPHGRSPRRLTRSCTTPHAPQEAILARRRRVSAATVLRIGLGRRRRLEPRPPPACATRTMERFVANPLRTCTRSAQLSVMRPRLG